MKASPSDESRVGGWGREEGDDEMQFVAHDMLKYNYIFHQATTTRVWVVVVVGARVARVLRDESFIQFIRTKSTVLIDTPTWKAEAHDAICQVLMKSIELAFISSSFSLGFNCYRLSAICAMSDTLNRLARLNQKKKHRKERERGKLWWTKSGMVGAWDEEKKGFVCYFSTRWT